MEKAFEAMEKAFEAWKKHLKHGKSIRSHGKSKKTAKKWKKEALQGGCVQERLVDFGFKPGGLPSGLVSLNSRLGTKNMPSAAENRPSEGYFCAWGCHEIHPSGAKNSKIGQKQAL